MKARDEQGRSSGNMVHLSIVMALSMAVTLGA